MIQDGEEINFSLTESQLDMLSRDKDFQRVVSRIVFNDGCAIKKSYEDMVIDKVCEHFEVDRDDLMSNSRKDIFVIPRYICMYILFKESKIIKMNRVDITKLFNRDRTLLNHAVKVVEWEIFNDRRLKMLVKNITNLIQIKKQHE